MVAVTMPSYGMAMTEGELVEWRVSEGDLVSEGDVLAEIETDKSTVELVAPEAGVVTAIAVAAGELAEVGVALCSIQPSGLTVVSPPRPVANPVPANSSDMPPAATPAAPSSTAPAEVYPGPSAPTAASTAESRQPHRLTPRQRSAAAVAAPAPDILSPARPDNAPEPDSAPEQGSSYRRVIAERVTRSWQEVPHFSVTRQMLCERLVAAHRESPAVGSTLTDHLILVTVRALAMAGIDGNGVTLAVDTPRGVSSATVLAAPDDDLAAVALARAAAVERARSGRLIAEDLAPTAPIMLSNLGAYGVDQFVGVLPLGQPLLLTLGAIAPRVIAAGEGSMRTARTVHATITADHRQFDGADIGRLLAFVSDILNNYA